MEEMILKGPSGNWGGDDKRETRKKEQKIKIDKKSKSDWAHFALHFQTLFSLWNVTFFQCK
jgi:hypothetical protein